MSDPHGEELNSGDIARTWREIPGVAPRFRWEDQPEGDGYYWVLFLDTPRMLMVIGDQMFVNGCGYRLTDFPKAKYAGPMPDFPPLPALSVSDASSYVAEESSSPGSLSETQPESIPLKENDGQDDPSHAHRLFSPSPSSPLSAYEGFF